MDTDLVVISLFGLQCALTLTFCVWGTYQIANIKGDIQQVKKDVNNLGTMIRHNRVSIEGKLGRFITETASKFNKLNIDSNFTYPNEKP